MMKKYAIAKMSVIVLLLLLPFTSVLHADGKDAQKEVLQYAPTLCFDYKEKYFPVDVHGDDYNVTNNHENYEKGLFPDKPVCYYNVVSYDNFKVYEYWFYYAYNEYNYYWIRINDVHEHDFAWVFVWVDKNGSPFFIATSMHLWVQGGQYNGENHPLLYVERGGHGMSLNKRLIDGIPIVFEKQGKILEWKDFIFKDFSDLISHSHEDLDNKGYYKTDEIAIIRIKAPWLEIVFNDPDVVRRSISATELYLSMWLKLWQLEFPQLIKKLITLLSSFLISKHYRQDLHKVLLLAYPLHIV